MADLWWLGLCALVLILSFVFAVVRELVRTEKTLKNEALKKRLSAAEERRDALLEELQAFELAQVIEMRITEVTERADGSRVCKFAWKTEGVGLELAEFVITDQSNLNVGDVIRCWISAPAKVLGQ